MAKYISNALLAKRELFTKEKKALHSAGIIVQKHVTLNIDMLGIIDTGRLKGSYGFQIDMKHLVVYNGTNVDYAGYQEFGTGIFAEGGMGRQTPWAFQLPNGNWVTTVGQVARPHLRPAYTQNVKEIQTAMNRELAR